MGERPHRHRPVVGGHAAERIASDERRASAEPRGAKGRNDHARSRRAGIVRVFDLDEVFNCAGLLARQRIPKGPRLAIITNAGGPGVMACDALLGAAASWPHFRRRHSTG